MASRRTDEAAAQTSLPQHPPRPEPRPPGRTQGPDRMTEHLAVERTDIAFAVPFVHRLRFTTDVLGAEQDVLLEVMERSGPNPARVQFWLDAHVADTRPDLAPRLAALAAAHPDRVVQAGDVQVVPGGEAIKNDIHLL